MFSRVVKIFEVLGLRRVLHPDRVAVRSGDRRPADEPGTVRPDRGRDRGPAHVEPERRAPAARAVARDRADMGVERKRLPGDPGERDRDGDRRRGSVFRRPDDRVVRERRAGRELELVAARAGDRVPAERGRPREGVRHDLVRAEQERVQAGRRLVGRARAGRPAQREHGEEDSSRTGASHEIVFGRLGGPGVPRTRDSERCFQGLSGREHERVLSWRRRKLHRGGEPVFGGAARERQRRPAAEVERVGQTDQRLA